MKKKSMAEKVFNDKCPIVPEIIANNVVREAATLFDFLGSEAFSDSEVLVMVRHLSDRAEDTCRADAEFRHKIIETRGDLGRDRLYAFMRHWLSAVLLEKYGERLRDNLDRRCVFEAFLSGEDSSGASRARIL